MKRLCIAGILALVLAQPLEACAHALPDRAVPGAGAVLARAPATVTIHFDAELEPIFSTLIVRDRRGVQVSEGKGRVAAHDAAVISTRLISAQKGIYHVYWSVVSRDGHRTEGDYTFTVGP